MAAATKTILKLTNTEAVIKISGVAGDTATISLATDLLKTGLEVLNGVAPRVTIAGFMVSGYETGRGSVDRNSVRVLTLTAISGVILDFTGNVSGFCVDSQNETSDIVVSITGGETQVYIYLKKAAGYKSTDSLSTQNS